MPCLDKPYEKPPSLQILRDYLPPHRNEKYQFVFHLPNQIEISCTVTVHMVRKKHQRQTFAHLTVSPRLYFTQLCCLFPLSLFSYLQSSVAHCYSNSIYELKMILFLKPTAQFSVFPCFQHFLQTLCRRDARCSGPSLSPRTARCTEHRMPCPETACSFLCKQIF